MAGPADCLRGNNLQSDSEILGTPLLGNLCLPTQSSGAAKLFSLQTQLTSHKDAALT